VSALVRGAIMEISTYRPGEEKEIHRRVTFSTFSSSADPRGMGVGAGAGAGEKEISCFGPVTRPDNFSSLSMLRPLRQEGSPLPPRSAGG